MIETNGTGPGTPIVITGMHRSGTSMVARELQRVGLHLGSYDELIDPAPDNPDGFFENTDVVTVNDDLLEAAGGAWDDPPPAPLSPQATRLAVITQEARQAMAGLAVDRPWGWKDPRACLTAPFWVELLEGARFVVCLRHPLEVALSLKRRNQISFSLGLRLWRTYYEALIQSVEPGRRLVTHYDAHFEHGAEELIRLAGFVGLDGAAATAEGAPPAADPALRHHRLELSLTEAGVAHETIDLYRRLCEESGRLLEPEPEPGAETAGHLDRTRLDLALAREHLARRDAHVASLRREREELRGRVGSLEQDRRLLRARADQLGAAITELGDELDSTVQTVQDGLAAAGAVDAVEVLQGRSLLRAHVPTDEPVLIVGKGDLLGLTRARWRLANFPQDATGDYPGFALGTDESCIAHLEALRTEGWRHLLIPRRSRWWLERFPCFAAHLAASTGVTVDDPEEGLLLDLGSTTRPVRPRGRALPRMLEELGRPCPTGQSVLDLTGQVSDHHAPGWKVFAPPDDGRDGWLYPDGSVDIVLVEAGSTLQSAQRLARLGVLEIEHAIEGLPMVTRVIRRHVPAPRGGLVVIPTSAPDERWAEQFPAVLETLDEDAHLYATGTRLPEECDLVALIDPGVVVLPGATAAARRLLDADPAVGAVAPLLLDRQGAVAAAGDMLFADGSWHGIAAGSYDTSAPEHSYVRDACGAAGLTFLRPEVVDPRTPASHRDWAARCWEQGTRVRYQPDAVAVRLPGYGVPTEPAVDRWARVRGRRPAPPAVLDDGAWRHLLAAEKVQEDWS